MTPLELAAAMRAAAVLTETVNSLVLNYQRGQMTADALAAELVRISKAQHHAAAEEHRQKPREGEAGQ